jgi:hypothetical protein
MTTYRRSRSEGDESTEPAAEPAAEPEAKPKRTKDELQAAIRETPRQELGELQAELDALLAEEKAAKAPPKED